MSYRALPLVALVPVVALGSIAAHAQVASGSFGGHFYEVYSADGITWEAANTDATALSLVGAPAHLATITTAEEDAFLEGLRQAEGLSTSQLWVGGFQSLPCDVGEEPTCGWMWVNGEGAFPGTNGGPVYANWFGGEPNDVGGVEDHLTIGRFGELPGWNDEGSAPDSIGGYVVEYSPVTVTLDVDDCLTTAGCETFEGQTLVFPPGFVPPPNPTFTAEATLFLDDLSLCAGESLEPRVLFDSDPGPSISADALIIPAIFCAFKEVAPGMFEPRPYVVVKTTANFAIPQGTVIVTNDTSETLADNYQCTLPVVGDPQHQQVALWQSTLHTLMLEDGHPEVGVFAGAAGDYAIDCGSTRGAVRGSSYHVIGKSIFTGQSFALNQGFVFDTFVALTRYQLVLSLEAIQAAKEAGAIKQGDSQKMQSQVENAIKSLDRGNYGGALTHVDNFVKFAAKAKYNVTPGFNHSGELQGRSLHNQFMLREKIVTFPYAD